MRKEDMDKFESWLLQRQEDARSSDRGDYACGIGDALDKFRALRSDTEVQPAQAAGRGY